MPIRTASLTKRISDNGQALHRAKMSRGNTDAADREPSEAEQALIEERRSLKAERDRRQEQATQAKPSATDRLQRTHHAQPKDKPKAVKERDAKEVKKPKARMSRAEKHAEKAAAQEAARHRAPKKPAK
jgi:hypothetical protein